MFAPMPAWSAPATTVSSLIATDSPSKSFAAPSAAVSFAVSVASAQPEGVS